jgi:predicted TIM-barrel fold metal-dependent hydrolase
VNCLVGDAALCLPADVCGDDVAAGYAARRAVGDRALGAPFAPRSASATAFSASARAARARSCRSVASASSNADLLRRLPTQLVFDHMGQPTLPAGPEHASFAILRGLIDRGRTWVKLSGA